MNEQDNQPMGECPELPPRTIPERLDAARDGQEFIGVLNDLFRSLEKHRDQ